MAELPCTQRVLAFLEGCGLYDYGLRFAWFDKHHFLHGSNPRDDWFSVRNEAELQQCEHTSLNRSIFIGNVFERESYYLELDHGYYRLRYSQVSKMRPRLIHDLLAEKGITQYELIQEVSEGRNLPPYQGSEIEDCSGIIVTPTSVYSFWLGWANGHHTLGEERTLWMDGKERSFWDEYSPGPEEEREIEGARRRIRLRRRSEHLALEGQSEMWEVCEEELHRLAD